MSYRTIMYCTSNENGREEIELELGGSWVHYLRNAIKNRSFDVDNVYKETWIWKYGCWIDKKTEKEADFRKILELHMIKMQFVHLRGI